MEDSSLLERMGRELKCPICLSLLSSAASLSCNHVFCNLCIRKSMKSGLCCPVCKVPYQRREVRPAPHMDNLVNVYKSMEAATGINMLVTQTVPAINSSDGERPSIDESSDRAEMIKEPCKGKRTRTTKKKQLTKNSKLNAENSGRNSQPSIAENKRVQVPQYPLQETPMKPTISKIDKTEAVNHLSHTSLEEDGEPCFPPFFWLREKEDMDKSSQETDVDFFSDLSPVNAPTFSDIKDSEDEAPSKSSPKENLQSKLNGGKYFDSEMFEWSQRACSPDLLSTPIKMQIGDTKKFAEVFKGISKLDGTTNEGKIREAPGCLTRHSRKKNIIPDDVRLPSRSKSSRKRYRNSSKRGNDMHSNQIVGQVSGISFKGSVDKRIQKHCGESKAGARISETDGSPESVSYISAEANLPNEIEENQSAKESVSCTEIVKREEKILGIGARNSVTRHCRSNGTKKRKQAAENHNMEKEVTPASSKGHETKGLQRSKLFRKSNSGNQKIDIELQPRGRVELLDNRILLDRARADVQGMEVPLIAETMDRVQELSDQGNADTAVKTRTDRQLGDQALKKCDTSSSITLCAFCCSTEETEASGEMVHYSKGTQVSADYEGGSNIIHSHKSCAEWAPNVYFEGDVAVNLKAELARSRRIKCCLCGVKGAALGCFQNSCRKSFHVPCAKMVSQCRWDEENFVMLCPLHSSSKLPCEVSGSQAKHRKCDQNRKSRPEQSQADAKQHTQSTQSTQWDSHSLSAKLV
ncbi:hypothetical protein Droror1_Dr00018300 [Drosera rotundifolia]